MRQRTKWERHASRTCCCWQNAIKADFSYLGFPPGAIAFNARCIRQVSLPQISRQSGKRHLLSAALLSLLPPAAHSAQKGRKKGNKTKHLSEKKNRRKQNRKGGERKFTGRNCRPGGRFSGTTEKPGGCVWYQCLYGLLGPWVLLYGRAGGSRVTFGLDGKSQNFDSSMIVMWNVLSY